MMCTQVLIIKENGHTCHPIHLYLDQCFDFACLSHLQQHVAKERVRGISNDLMKKGKHFILIRHPMDILVKYFINYHVVSA